MAPPPLPPECQLSTRRSQYGIARILVSGVLASCRPDRDLQSAPTCPAVSLIAKWRGFSTLFDILGTAKIGRSEEHTSELQSLMRISYAVFCLKKKTHIK